MNYPCECGCGVIVERTIAATANCRQRIHRNVTKRDENKVVMSQNVTESVTKRDNRIEYVEAPKRYNPFTGKHEYIED